MSNILSIPPFVFFGTPDFAVGVLDQLEKRGLFPALVVTVLDAPAGRGQKLTPPPVKVWAEVRGIQVLQPEKLDEDFSSKLKTKNYQLLIVAAYGKILPEAILDIPEHGALNVHPSLLPRLRGSSPIQSAILGEEKTGVTIILMDEKMDHGGIIAQRERIIRNFANDPPKASELSKDLARFGGELLLEIMPEWISGNISPAPQDDRAATYCKKIAKEDGRIDLAADPHENLRKIRSFDEWPGAYFFMQADRKQIRVKILDAEVQDGRLVIKDVLPEGRKKMPYRDFLQGISRLM